METEQDRAGRSASERLNPVHVAGTAGHLYFVGDLQRSMVIKIGWTAGWGLRFATLQSGYPFTLTPLLVIPGTGAEEAVILRRFCEHKTKEGRGEWFHAAESLLAFIAWLQGAAVDMGTFQSFVPFLSLRGRPNLLDSEEQLRAARTVTR